MNELIIPENTTLTADECAQIKYMFEHLWYHSQAAWYDPPARLAGHRTLVYKEKCAGAPFRDVEAIYAGHTSEDLHSPIPPCPEHSLPSGWHLNLLASYSSGPDGEGVPDPDVADTL